jgi:hypothetical protein
MRSLSLVRGLVGCFERCKHLKHHGSIWLCGRLDAIRGEFVIPGEAAESDRGHRIKHKERYIPLNQGNEPLQTQPLSTPPVQNSLLKYDTMKYPKKRYHG